VDLMRSLFNKFAATPQPSVKNSPATEYALILFSRAMTSG